MEKDAIGAHRSGRHNGMTEKGGAPLGGNGRTKDVRDRQPSCARQFGETDAIGHARHQTDCLFAACEIQRRKTSAGALVNALGRGLVIAIAVCGCDQGRYKGHCHKHACKRSCE